MIRAPQPASMETYGMMSFEGEVMRDYLDRSSYNEIRQALDERQPLTTPQIEAFAKAALQWAYDRDCTHVAHVFQPLTGGVAEKHDVLFEMQRGGSIQPFFSGKRLLSSETDGSSFPVLGARTTHEARGNCIWDPRSAVTVSKHGDATTLRVPAIFYSWNGHALDYKTPLLRSEDALGQALLGCLKEIGETEHTRVHVFSGLEQEFFLVDRHVYDRRPDLQQTGRTLLGRSAARGQDHADHYFRVMSPRAQQCIHDAEKELWQLGVPNSTRHREVAPGQFEMAAYYQEANQSNDNNLLMMQVIRDVAARHGLVALFHEKPFAHLNGSGKHNNWSFGTNVDGTMLSPSSKYFMLALAAFVKGVHTHNDVVRASVAGASNDHRIGSHEAPPGIMSIYLGGAATDMVQNAMHGKEAVSSHKKEPQAFGVSYLPEFIRQATDRNRTSPISFCDNRFELRALGSSHNSAWSTTVLNTVTAEAFNSLTESIRQAKAKGVENPMEEVIAQTFREHQDILFDGDGYSQEWHEEARRRGLFEAVDTPTALSVLEKEKTQKLFTSCNVLSAEELSTRSQVFNSNYVLDVRVEVRCMVDMLCQQVVPETLRYLNSFKGAQGDLQELETDIQLQLAGVLKGVKALREADKKASQLFDEGRFAEAAHEIRASGVSAMEEARACADQLEALVDSTEWSLPSYREMHSIV